jgi:hypothetical protein
VESSSRYPPVGGCMYSAVEALYLLEGQRMTTKRTGVCREVSRVGLGVVL